jgi:hypothetical protein
MFNNIIFINNIRLLAVQSLPFYGLKNMKWSMHIGTYIIKYISYLRECKFCIKRVLCTEIV